MVSAISASAVIGLEAPYGAPISRSENGLRKKAV
jgi:hypothetical protein